eukprot:gene22486-49439_t
MFVAASPVAAAARPQRPQHGHMRGHSATRASAYAARLRAARRAG